MKKISRIVVLLAVLSLVLTAFAWAQPAAPGTGRGGPAAGAGMGLQYDPQKVETITGEVTQVQKSPRRSKGVHVQVKTDKETVIAISAPAFYLDQQKLNLAAGDKVEIKGSRIKHPQMAIILAGELKKGDQVVKFRDEQGKPLWSMGPKRQLPAK
jgi:hypothetical protein